ncbi:MAG: hypothetical protein KGK03_03420 [Candidatus Omnitrophica bacterium]|nr:hypothetical protein [Candidatus Omnitrophota bacterium]MDE2222103.1 hypothetical protein [Candidatus Omnitrophota bacterium]
MRSLHTILIYLGLTLFFLGQAQASDRDRDRDSSQSTNAERVIVQGPVRVVVPQLNAQPNIQPSPQKYWVRQPEPARQPEPVRQPEPARQPSTAGRPSVSQNEHSRQDKDYDRRRPDHDRGHDHDSDHDRNRGFYLYTPPVVSYINVVPNQTILQDVNQEYTQPAADAGYMPVFINGILYFYDSSNGAFFQKTFAGYNQIDPLTSLQGTVTIGIPNNSGGYTNIRLQVVPNGYIGPQGEFYPQFPSLIQLQAIYVH